MKTHIKWIHKTVKPISSTSTRQPIAIYVKFKISGHYGTLLEMKAYKIAGQFYLTRVVS